MLLALLALSTALAQAPPDRQVPADVMSEVRLLDVRFHQAVTSDCDPRFCFPKGCHYVAHAVADRAPGGSLPGLGQDAGPGSTVPQEYLTEAVCAFGWEESANSRDMTILARRLEAKLSRGWLSVTVDSAALPSVPAYLTEPEPDTEADTEAAPVAEIAAEPWSLAVAIEQLWTALLPHVFWMIGLLLVTMAAVVLIWAARRVGKRSVEEELMLSEGGLFDDPGEDPEAEPQSDAVDAPDEAEMWRVRLAAMDADAPDAEIQALLGALLRSGDLPLLARAVLTFPDTLPRAFPSGGAFAAAKRELATYLQTVDDDDLPSEPELYKVLNRHALSAALVTQSDTAVIASLQEDFGASGLAELAGSLPPRLGGLVFALSSPHDQWEVARLLDPERVALMSELLLHSNRMDAAEMSDLFGVATAVKSGEDPPTARAGAVTDRGAPFDAVSALSVLLESLDATRRQQLFRRVLTHFHGTLPAWHRGLFFSDLLLSLPAESRADLLLSVDSQAVAALLTRVDPSTRERILEGTPTALVNAVRAAEPARTPERQVELERQARTALSRGFQEALARANTSLESLLAPDGQG